MITDDFIRWGKPGDGQGSRLGMLLAGAIVTLGMLALFATDQGNDNTGNEGTVTIEQAPVTPFCASEDEVMVKVVVDSYDMPAGTLRCVHIDYLEGPQP
jgi:hypothetical protein